MLKKLLLDWPVALVAASVGILAGQQIAWALCTDQPCGEIAATCHYITVENRKIMKCECYWADSAAENPIKMCNNTSGVWIANINADTDCKGTKPAEYYWVGGGGSNSLCPEIDESSPSSKYFEGSPCFGGWVGPFGPQWRGTCIYAY